MSAYFFVLGFLNKQTQKYNQQLSARKIKRITDLNIGAETVLNCDMEDDRDSAWTEVSWPGKWCVKHPNWFARGQCAHAALRGGWGLVLKSHQDTTQLWRSCVASANKPFPPRAFSRLPLWVNEANLVNPTGWRKWPVVNSHPACAGQRTHRQTTAP